MNWLDQAFPRGYIGVQNNGAPMPPEQAINFVLPFGSSIVDDPQNKRTTVTIQFVTADTQQVTTIATSGAHLIGQGVAIPSTALTTCDAEVYATDGAGNWAWWRLTRGFLRTGTGNAVAEPTSTIVAAGFPIGSNSGGSPAGWAATIELGSGANANIAYLNATGQATWYWFLDSSQFPSPAISSELTVTAMSPSSGTTTGGTALTITGTNFETPPTVTIGGVAATSVVLVSSTSITCVSPALGTGTYDVVVTNPDGTSATLIGGWTAGSGLPTGYAAWWQVSALSNGAVSSWTATGSAPPTLQQATGANQPTKSSGPNIITFNGTSDGLIDTATATFTAAFTVGIKFKLNAVPTGIGNFQTLLELFKSGGGDGMVIAFVPSAGGYGPISVSGHTPNTGSVFASPTLDTGTHRLIVTYDGVSGNNVPSGYQVMYDGVLQTLSAGGTLLAVSDNRLGELNNSGTPSNWFNGETWDLVVYPSVLSSPNLSQLDTWLQSL